MKHTAVFPLTIVLILLFLFSFSVIASRKEKIANSLSMAAQQGFVVANFSAIEMPCGTYIGYVFGSSFWAEMNAQNGVEESLPANDLTLVFADNRDDDFLGLNLQPLPACIATASSKITVTCNRNSKFFPMAAASHQPSLFPWSVSPPNTMPALKFIHVMR